METHGDAYRLQNWVVVPIFKKGHQSVVDIIPWEALQQLANLRFRRNMTDLILIMES